MCVVFVVVWCVLDIELTTPSPRPPRLQSSRDKLRRLHTAPQGSHQSPVTMEEMMREQVHGARDGPQSPP